MVTLLFHCHLSRTDDLIDGRLLLLEDGRLREQYRATSGAPGWQNWDDQRQRGKGPIPRPDLLAGKVEYSVSAKPIALPNTPGVSGDFYPILPFEVEFKDGQTRGDFGIHFDANVPGSAGCIVLPTDSGWSGFQRQMRSLVEGGVESVPLVVSYSF